MLGSFCLTLHSHLPYVLNHGVWPHGADWLHEAAFGTYIPLVSVLDELHNEGYHPKITLGISPVLAEQLAHPTFRESFTTYLNQRILSARQDEKYFRQTNDEPKQIIAQFWLEHFQNIKNLYHHSYEKNILQQFCRLQEQGIVEIITCAATHGYFPLLGYDENIRAQLALAMHTHEKHFRTKPRGIWIPECAYRPHYRWKNSLAPFIEEKEREGIEELLYDSGLHFFFTDFALINSGTPVGVYLERFGTLRELWKNANEQIEHDVHFSSGEKSPCDVYVVQSQLGSGKRVAVFTREPHTASQVWSGIMGYPGDTHYLEFHKKYFPGGHRYWRVTDSKIDLGKKELYEQARIEERLEQHSTHFVALARTVLEEHRKKFSTNGIICAPYDSELFGHWWFEGPRFLKKVFRKLEDEKEFLITTASEELERRTSAEVISLPEGSWGEGGHHKVWLNPKTEWTWKLVYEVEQSFRLFLQNFSARESDMLTEVLQQAARELLIMEASDWQFLISQKSAADYSHRRLLVHFNYFFAMMSIATKLVHEEMLTDNDVTILQQCKKRNDIFGTIDLQWWQ